MKVRSSFPALIDGAAHFDGPGGSQTPDVVANAIRATLLSPIANQGSRTAAERNAEAAVVQCRAALADLLNADPGGVVFGRSMTDLTFDFARTLAKRWQPGDEVVVSRLDHDANVRPWVIAAEAVGATVRWIDFDPDTAELHDAHVRAALSERTKLVALTGASNLLGTRPDLVAAGRAVHEVGALFYVDGVHLTAHAPIDVAAIDADFFACSPYKFFGPHCGVVAGRVDLLEELKPDKLVPATDAVPERFELGTLPYELMAGTTAAVDFIAGIAPGSASTRRDRVVASMTALEQYEDELRADIEDRLADLPGVTVRSRAKHRTPTLLVTFADRSTDDAYTYLAARGVNAPAGSFYAYEPARRLGLGEAGGLRIGLAPYNDRADIDRLLDGLAAFLG